MVYVSFTITDTGDVIDYEVSRDPDPNGELGIAAVEALTKLFENNKWIPGQSNGMNVNVKFSMPVRFKLH